jgi:hypothetical protein
MAVWCKSRISTRRCATFVRLAGYLDTAALDELASERRIWSPAPRAAGNRGFPVVRLNALELIGTPTVCRRVVCGIGGVAEVRSAIEAADLPVLATRSRAGVLAFGADADVRAVLSTYGIESFDLHAIEVRRLRYESRERGLLREALTRALIRSHGMTGVRRRSSDLLTPSSVDDVKWAPLKRLTGSLGGTDSMPRDDVVDALRRHLAPALQMEIRNGRAPPLESFGSDEAKPTVGPRRSTPTITAKKA